jgi:hypothetical protein
MKALILIDGGSIFSRETIVSQSQPATPNRDLANLERAWKGFLFSGDKLDAHPNPRRHLI